MDALRIEAAALAHGPGYSTDTEGWIDPKKFIRKHRPRTNRQVRAGASQSERLACP